ncbi:hypothetical protein STEG23_033203, partial [Scotinomys teguina]
SEIITFWGYPSKEYEAVTKDGYILPINRIPHGKNSTDSSDPKEVVFCQHGLFSTAGVWVANPPDNSLAFFLADAGYDVWMGNSRGSTWAKKHLHLDPESKEFWAFSYDEMIKYDLPATINFILNKTGQKQIYYVGHSQGTLIALGAFSTNQQLAESIKLSVLLAPVATVQFIKGSGRLPSYFTPTAFKLLFGEREFLPTVAFSELSGYVCHVAAISTACAAVLESLGGYSTQLNKSRIDVYITHSLARTSVQTLLHYGQAIDKGVFQAYDRGSPTLNMLHYNQAKHYAISAKVNKSFTSDTKPPIVQYEVNFENGIECGGAHVKLLSKTSELNLDQSHDKTFYTIRFGPDKCGEGYKLHFIFRHKNPKTDQKPEDWYERSKIPDPDAVKPDDWNEDDPAKIPAEEATKPEGWLDDEPEYIPDPVADKPEDWDEDMDGEWEAPQIANPKCESAPECGV